MLLRLFILLLSLPLWGGLPAGMADEAALRVGVLDNSPPMAFRSENGELTGFSIAIIRAVCQQMHANCQFVVAPFAEMLPGLEGGKLDVAAVSMLNTPERRARVLLSKPYYRSRTLWFGRPGISPGDEKFRVAVMSGSAQERYALTHHWQTRPVPGHGDLAEQIAQGHAQAMLIPQSNAIYLMQQASFRKLGLVSQVMDGEGLGGDVSFGIAPGKAELKKNIDMALERINRDGRYDRINSEFLPFRID